jgi:hypothetical protein
LVLISCPTRCQQHRARLGLARPDRGRSQPCMAGGPPVALRIKREVGAKARIPKLTAPPPPYLTRPSPNRSRGHAASDGKVPPPPRPRRRPSLLSPGNLGGDPKAAETCNDYSDKPLRRPPLHSRRRLHSRWHHRHLHRLHHRHRSWPPFPAPRHHLHKKVWPPISPSSPLLHT